MARLLKAHEIDVRIGTVSKNKNKAMVLLYKDARCDMSILDEVYGSENWQSKYERIADVLFCSIGVYNPKIKEWVWKSSNGVESLGTGEDDPNNIKGEASDAFKRAGFMWGIGRELYEWKNLWIDYDKEKDKWERFRVAKIGYDEKGKPTYITIVNSKNKVVYQYGKADLSKEDEIADEDVEIIENEPVGEIIDETSDFKSIEELEKEVRQENIMIWQELVKVAYEIYKNADYANPQVLAKTSPTDYFEELKIPVTKLELTKENRKPKLNGSAFVIVNEKFIEDYKENIKANTEIPF